VKQAITCRVVDRLICSAYLPGFTSSTKYTGYYTAQGMNVPVRYVAISTPCSAASQTSAFGLEADALNESLTRQSGAAQMLCSGGPAKLPNIDSGEIIEQRNCLKRMVVMGGLQMTPSFCAGDAGSERPLAEFVPREP
jgi:hypothetical protein